MTNKNKIKVGQTTTIELHNGDRVTGKVERVLELRSGHLVNCE